MKTRAAGQDTLFLEPPCRVGLKRGLLSVELDLCTTSPCFLHPPAFPSENFCPKPCTASSSQGVLRGTRLRQGRKCLGLPSCDLAPVSPRRFMPNAGLFSLGHFWGSRYYQTRDTLPGWLPELLLPSQSLASRGAPLTGHTCGDHPAPLQGPLDQRLFQDDFSVESTASPYDDKHLCPSELRKRRPFPRQEFFFLWPQVTLTRLLASALASSDINEEPGPIPQPRGCLGDTYQYLSGP